MSNKQNDILKEIAWVELREAIYNTREETIGMPITEVGKIIGKEFCPAEMQALIDELNNQIKIKELKNEHQQTTTKFI